MKAMNDYVIFTDTACDIEASMLHDWGVHFISMSFSFEDESREYYDRDMEITEFYQKMRAGGMAKTAAANPEAYKLAFEEVLKEGRDILHLGLSAALSSSFSAALSAAEDLRQIYPERKIILVDTLSASAGEGMLVHLAVQKRNSGATIEENAAYIESIKRNVCHWFVVDDLDYLKRGGRISPTVAFVGKVLSIKPILHVTEDGKPINVSKVRGTKAAIKLFADKYAARQMDWGPVFISHADNMAAVEILVRELKSRFGIDVDLITHIGTVLGSHTGPGAIAFYFLDKER